jgi:hypothetical protein
VLVLVLVLVLVSCRRHGGRRWRCVSGFFILCSRSTGRVSVRVELVWGRRLTCLGSLREGHISAHDSQSATVAE